VAREVLPPSSWSRDALFSIPFASVSELGTERSDLERLRCMESDMDGTLVNMVAKPVI